MPDVYLRRLIWGRTVGRAVAVVAALSAGAGCGGGAVRVPYLDDGELRRATLVASLVNPDNGYARLRLAEYGPGRRWDALPEWNPRGRPLAMARIDDGSARELSPLDGAVGPCVDLLAVGDASSEPALRSLGEQAFFGYPAQLEPAAAAALASREALSHFGLWADEERGAGGLVEVALADGSTALALSCSSCHAAVRAGRLVAGVANGQLDLAALHDAYRPVGEPPGPAWGPGRLDVSSQDGSEPVRIADLLPTAALTHLHHDGNVELRDRATLAVRIETGLIVAHGTAVRPPRLIAWALATYLESLLESLPSPSVAAAVAPAGAAIFQARCAACHVPPRYTGSPVAIEAIGTDPLLGRSPERGTGRYRVPSLRGLSLRGLLLHDGALARPEQLLSVERLQPDYRGGVRPGPVPGHLHGLDLDAGERSALLAFLSRL